MEGLDRKEFFIYQSIVDTQATIRAMDVKIGFLFIIIFMPLAGIEKILDIAVEVFKKDSNFIWMIVSIFMLWLLSLGVLFRGVIATSNPSACVSGSEGVAGIFFNGGLYKLSFIDNFINLNAKSEKNISSCLSDVPGDMDSAIKELMFELMKLAYIRDVKIKRFSFCVRLVLAWILLSVMTYITYRIV